jgi:hypothetical protein
MKTTLAIYRLNTNITLHSFGDEIGNVPILSTTLRTHQNRVVNDLGQQIIDIDSKEDITHSEYIIFEDDLFFTDNFFSEAVILSTKSNNSLRFCLVANDFNKAYIFDHSKQQEDCLKFDMYYLKKSDHNIVDSYIDQKTYDHFISIPKQLDTSGKMYHGQCATFATKIISPFHLLYTNLALNFNRTLKLQRFIPEWFVKKYIPFGGRLFYYSLKRLNKFGKNCRIHPTAVVEGCVLGDNVQIGANCVVRLSTLGDNTTLEENVTLTYSVLGPGCYVANGNIVNLCMCYENVFLIHGPYQFSLFGRSVGVMAVINCDFRLDQKSIRFMSSEGLIDSKQSLLGICYGHNSVVGGGNIIAPGRIVPNEIKIPPPKSILISKFDEYL